MSETFTGKVWVLGDDIDTDIIIPTEYLALKTVQDMTPYAPPGTRIPDQAWRYHRSRQEFRLWFFQGTGAGDHQGTWHPLRDRQILCPDLLPQFHQQRASPH